MRAARYRGTRFASGRGRWFAAQCQALALCKVLQRGDNPTISAIQHDSEPPIARRDPRLLVRAPRRAKLRQTSRRVVSQGRRVRRGVARDALATPSKQRWREALRRGRIRAARWHACCCWTSSRATAIAIHRARSPETLTHSRSPTRPLRAGDDAGLIPVERWFLYMPFEHAESVEAQQQSVELFARLATETGMAEPLVWAERHAAVIRRFGRFPHRNAILGRASTPEEIAFLATPGSGF